MLKEIEEKIELLIKDKTLREKMSKNAIDKVKGGKFSIKKRNNKLKQIYEKALK